jgi:hypothetical protein
VQQRFLGRASHFLPATPSYEIVLIDNKSGSASAANGSSSKGAVDDSAGLGSNHNIIRNGTTGPPSHTSSLNILCVAGRSNSLSVYLHGRYRILTLVPPSSPSPSNSSQIVCAPDLSCIVVAPSIPSQSGETSESSSTHPPTRAAKNNSQLVYWYSTPVLSRRHHDLSFLSSSYSFVSANLHCISDTIEKVTELWNETFRPMETKWNELSKLLTSYGVVTNSTEDGKYGQDQKNSTSTIGNVCRTQLRHVLVMGLNGSRAKEGSAASAMSQFLGQLNEHGLMRLLKSLEANLATAEDLIRQSILAPAQALVYHCGSELLGMTMAQCSVSGSGSRCVSGRSQDGHLLDDAVVQQALKISRILYVAAERLVGDIVTIHHRLKDLVRWMVWQIQCVKMQQTSEEEGKNSSSHNTNMARPPQAVLDRVVTFLSDRGLHGKARARSVANTSPAASHSSNDTLLLTEVILGVHVMVSYNVGSCVYHWMLSYLELTLSCCFVPALYNRFLLQRDHFVASSDEASENVTDTGESFNQRERLLSLRIQVVHRAGHCIYVQYLASLIITRVSQCRYRTATLCVIRSFSIMLPSTTEHSSLYSVVQSTQKVYQKLFAGPRTTLSNSIQPTGTCMHDMCYVCPVAMP